MFQRECSSIPRRGSFQAGQSKVKENIMNQKQSVQTLLDSVQKGDFVRTKSLLADDFQFSGPIPEPINREAWLDMSARLKTAFPDLDYHFQLIGADDDVVKTTS